MPSRLEADIQREVTEYAGLLKLLSIRINVTGRKGWPDYMYGYRGRIFFIEYKKPGEKPDALQLYVHNQLKRQGFDVFVIDNTDYGKTLLEEWRRSIDEELEKSRQAIQR